MFNTDTELVIVYLSKEVFSQYSVLIVVGPTFLELYLFKINDIISL